MKSHRLLIKLPITCWWFQPIWNFWLSFVIIIPFLWLKIDLLSPPTGSRLWYTHQLPWQLLQPPYFLQLYWLVVYLPLWKIWVRQLGWWNSQYMEKKTCSKPPTSYKSLKSPIFVVALPGFSPCLALGALTQASTWMAPPPKVDLGNQPLGHMEVLLWIYIYMYIIIYTQYITYIYIYLLLYNIILTIWYIVYTPTLPLYSGPWKTWFARGWLCVHRLA